MTFDQLRGRWRADVLEWLGLVAALGLLACALPGPATVVNTLISGRLTFRPTGTGAVAQTAMMMVAAIAVWLLLAWIAVVAAIACCSRVPGITGRIAGQLLRRTAPPAMRQVLLAVVGASMVTAIAACGATPPAAAVPDVAAAGAAAPGVATAGVAAPVAPAQGRIAVEGSAFHPESLRRTVLPAGLRTPAGPPTPAGPAAPPVDVDWPATPAPHPAAPEVVRHPVVVLRGDSLWSIAARHLPATATPPEIEQAWHHWYAANAAVIGDNPDLILPGQILTPPSPGTGDSR